MDFFIFLPPMKVKRYMKGTIFLIPLVSQRIASGRIAERRPVRTPCLKFTSLHSTRSEYLVRLQRQDTTETNGKFKIQL